MDLELSPDQKAIVESVTSVLAKHAGAKRAIALDAEAGYDHALHGALHQAGFLSVLADAGPLEAVLVIETVARFAGVMSIGASALVLPALGRALEGAVALASSTRAEPTRFLGHARHVLWLDERDALLAAVSPSDVERVPSSFGFPLARFRAAHPPRGEALSGMAARARDLWRLALAAECVGAMEAALSLTIEYVSNRRQFGRAIGSFQAVRHRLAQQRVLVEGARLLTYEAAHHGVSAEGAAQAASYATSAARLVHAETHQLTGALGFTREHDLHVWSMRLQALRLELDGTSAHRRALAAARWGLSA